MKSTKDIMVSLAILTAGAIVGGTMVFMPSSQCHISAQLRLIIGGGVSVMLAFPVVVVFLTDLYVVGQLKKLGVVFAAVCLSWWCYAAIFKEPSFVEEKAFFRQFADTGLFLLLCSMFVPATLIKRGWLASLVVLLGGAAFLCVWSLLYSAHLVPEVSWLSHSFSLHVFVIPVVAIEVGAAKALSRLSLARSRLVSSDFDRGKLPAATGDSSVTKPQDTK